jgi:hypothetical protein
MHRDIHRGQADNEKEAMTKKPRTWLRWGIVYKNGAIDQEVYSSRDWARKLNHYAGRITQVAITETKPKKRRRTR